MHEMQTIVTDVSSVCLSRMHRLTPALHSEADLRLSFTVWGHLVLRSPNHFGLVFIDHGVVLL